MYSVVLLMALSGGAETPAFCGGSCGGGRGCSGGGLFSGRGCNSCSGGGLFSHGCRGSRGCSSCSGTSYCCGSNYCGGAGYCSGSGYCGGSGHCGGVIIGCSGGYGHCGGGVIIGCPGGVVVPPAKEMPKEKEKAGEVAAPATIVVTLPADARLTVDDAATSSTSSTRVLMSPTLEPGREFHYTLKAEIVRDGKTQATSQRITVRAGEQTRVNLQFPVASVAQK